MVCRHSYIRLDWLPAGGDPRARAADVLVFLGAVCGTLENPGILDNQLFIQRTPNFQLVRQIVCILGDNSGGSFPVLRAGFVNIPLDFQVVDPAVCQSNGNAAGSCRANRNRYSQLRQGIRSHFLHPPIFGTQQAGARVFVRGEFLLHLQKHPCFSRLGRLAPEIPSVFDSVQQPFCFRPPRSSVSGCILLNSRFRQNFQGQTRQHVGSGFGLGVSPASRKAPSAPADLCRRPHSLAGFSGCRLVLPPLGAFLLPPCDHAMNSSQEQGRQRSAPPPGGTV